MKVNHFESVLSPNHYCLCLTLYRFSRSLKKVLPKSIDVKSSKYGTL